MQDDPARRLIEYGRRWAIVSGERPSHDYTAKLLKNAHARGLTVYKLVGRWEGHREISWLIRDVGLLEAQTLARECDQDAFIHKALLGPARIHYRDGTWVNVPKLVTDKSIGENYSETESGWRFSLED